VNAQNTYHWDTENPHSIHEVPHHDQNMGLWCTVSDWRVMGPIFFLWHGEFGALYEQYLDSHIRRAVFVFPAG
jgi:hypothetical protein